MKNYKYIELIDRTAHGRRVQRSGKLYFIGDVTQELIDEIKLVDANESGYGDCRYYTTWNNISGTGWELFSVTPCGYSTETGNYVHTGTIEHSYIFRKEL